MGLIGFWGGCIKLENGDNDYSSAGSEPCAALILLLQALEES